LKLVQRWLESAAVLGDEAFDLLSQRGDVARNLFQRIALTFQLEKSALPVGDQGDHLVAVLRQHAGGLVGVGQQGAQLRVARV